MPVARAAAAVAPARAPPRPTRSRRQLQADAEDLADDLSRVLRVSQPKVAPKAAPAARRTVSATKAAVTKEPVADVKSRAPAARPRAKASAAPATTTTASTAKAPVRTSSSTTAKAQGKATVRAPAAPVNKVGSERVQQTTATTTKTKPKAPTPPTLDERPPTPVDQLEELPWMTSAGGLSPRERALAAQNAINAAKRTVMEASQAKYVYGANPAGAEGKWTDAGIKHDVATACAGVAVLREIYASDACRDQCCVFERGFFSMLALCVAIQMNREVLDMLIAAKPFVLRLYCSPVEPSTLPSSSKQMTVKELSSLTEFPLATSDLSEPVRTIINTFIMATWCCILSIKADEPKTLLALLSIPPLGDQHQLHPFNLAPSLPFSSAAAMGGHLYRRVAAVPVEKGADEYLRLRLLTAFATSLTVSASDSKARRNPPETVWRSVLMTMEAYLDCSADTAAQRKAATFIEYVVNIVDRICESRGEPRAEWYSGRWTQVAEIWIGAGRNLGDGAIIDRAQAALRGCPSADGGDDNLQSCMEQLSIAPVAVWPVDSAPLKLELSVKAARAEAARCSAALAKAYVDLTAIIDGNQADNGIAATLKDAELEPVLVTMCCLDESEAALEALQSCLRAVERVRRAVLKLFGTAEAQSEQKSILRQWMLRYIAFVHRLMSNTKNKTPCIAACMPGCFDSTIVLLRPGGLASGAPSQCDLLDALHTLLDKYGELLAPEQRSHSYFALTQTAYGMAVSATSAGSQATAVEFAHRACDWSVEAVTKFPSGDEDNALQEVSKAIPKRYELLGFCLKATDSVAALQAFCCGISWVSPANRQRIAEAAASKPVNQIFQGLKDIDVSVRRAVVALAADDPPQVDFPAMFWAELEARNLPVDVCGAICEHLLDALSPAQFRPLVQTVFVDLATRLLDIYAPDVYPLRRMRTNVRLMNFIITSGAAADQFESLCMDTVSLWNNVAVGDDSAFMPSKAELYASATILRALNAHYQAETVENVGVLGKAALEVARRLAFPAQAEKKAVARGSKAPTGGVTRTTRPAARAAPARAAPARTAPGRAGSSRAAPAKGRKAAPANDAAGMAYSSARICDPEQLAQLLQSLSALFGICGHVVLKIEALNILRAVQKSSEAMLDAYILTSGQLAAEYGQLGKHSRALEVFSQAVKHASAQTPASAASLVDLHLRFTYFLAVSGHLAQAREQFQLAEGLYDDIPGPNKNGTAAERCMQLCWAHERAALAYTAHAAIMMATADATRAVASLTIARRQWGRAAAAVALITAEVAVDADSEAKSADEGAAEAGSKSTFCFNGKHLSGVQWHYAEAVFESGFALFEALAQRGSPKECDYYIAQARKMVPAVGSSTLEARTATHAAELESRRLHYQTSAEQLELAAEVLAVDGSDAVDIQRIRGDLYSRQDDPGEADEMFAAAVERLCGLDGEFAAVEALLPVPPASAPVSPKAARTAREPLLPHALGHVLRQRAWLLREAGEVEEYDVVLQQLDRVPRTTVDKPEQLLLEARVAMHEAFSHFKTDLFMSSLTESTIAMTMGSPDKRAKERQSTRHSALVLLEKAGHAFRKALANVARTGRVEDVRQAGISLVLLGAFQTALGHGSPTITALAAGILASVPALTLHRELLPAVEDKYPDPEADDLDWPSLSPQALYSDNGDTLVQYWEQIRAKHEAFDLLHADYDLSSLPENWAVVAITVTDDRNTMLVSRHQNGHEPIVFCIPLDRQGRREGDDESELFTFDAGVAELNAIIEGSNASIRDIKNCHTPEDRKAWWKTRMELDTRLGALLATIEFCWLGAFKTVLNPRLEYDPAALQAFRERLDRIFEAALSSSGSETRRGTNVRLNDTLLACFATLPSSCKDEEIEDLVYFVLDVYQFHGVAVALAELDFDQIGVDVKSALTDLELAHGGRTTAPSDEHLLLALDKNVQGIPWESIPILRGRAVSRIPSLPFLLDTVYLSSQGGHTPGRWTIDARRARFFLNPGGDLKNTQERFDTRLRALERRGWSGTRGVPPSDGDMAAALGESELVMYFGHGGGEQYLSGTRVRALPRCAVTMLWGCSSGILRDQGDLDRTGTPNDYVLAGCPCLVANLWDVTDKDIDRLTAAVMDELGLVEEAKGASGGEGTSVVQAVSAARTRTALQYLTGAAPVVYGVPVYLRL